VRLSSLFEAKGYEVKPNVGIRGKSGTIYNAALVAKFQAAYHSSILVLFLAKHSFQKNGTISKDIGSGQKENSDIGINTMTEYVKMIEDLNVDKVFLVTDVDFSISAINLSQKYKNLELWNRKKLQEILPNFEDSNLQNKQDRCKKSISTKMSNEFIVKYAKKSAQKHSKGGLFGRNKVVEKVTNFFKFYYPYYDVDFESDVYLNEKVGGFFGKKEKIRKTVRTRASVDARNGSIVSVNSSGISYKLHFLDDLNEEAVEAFQLISGFGEFEKRILSGLLSYSNSKISSALMELSTYGVIEQIRPSPVTYRVLFHYPTNPAGFVSLLEAYTPSDISDESKVLEPTISPGSIGATFEKYWINSKILACDIVYYPFYKINYERDDNTRRSEIIDGVTGIKKEGLDE